MQESLYQTADAGLFISDSRCKNLSAGPFLGDSGCRRHSFIKVNAELFLLDSYAGPVTNSGCRRNFPDSLCSSFSIRQEMQDSIRQRMQETLYQTGDAGISPSLRQQMLYSLYWTADARNTLSGSGCRILSLRQRMQESLYQTTDA